MRDLGDEAPVVVDRVVDRAARARGRARSPPRRGRARCAPGRCPRPSRRSPRRRDPARRARSTDAGTRARRARRPGSAAAGAARALHAAQTRAKASASWRRHDERLAVHARARRTSRSGCTAMARLAGRVHGVVVQMTSEAGAPPSAARPGEGVTERELHVDRRRRLVLVLDLGLGERGLAVHAPVHRLEALVDEAAAHEAAELARDHRLVGGRQREVGLVPVAEDAQPPELLALDVDELGARTRGSGGASPRIHRLAHVAPGAVSRPSSLSTWCSMGRPWQSQPGHVDGVVARAWCATSPRCP